MEDGQQDQDGKGCQKVFSVRVWRWCRCWPVPVLLFKGPDFSKGISLALLRHQQTPCRLVVFQQIQRMGDAEGNIGRLRRAGGGGFYDYPSEKGAKKSLWPQLKPLFEKADAEWDITDLKDRLLYRQAVETARCLSENVLTTVHDANIGSIFGIGFPAWTGGAMQFIYGMGMDAFVKRADELAARFGAGFALTDEVKAAIQRYQPVY